MRAMQIHIVDTVVLGAEQHIRIEVGVCTGVRIVADTAHADIIHTLVHILENKRLLLHDSGYTPLGTPLAELKTILLARPFPLHHNRVAGAGGGNLLGLGAVGKAHLHIVYTACQRHCDGGVLIGRCPNEEQSIYIHTIGIDAQRCVLPHGASGEFTQLLAPRHHIIGYYRGYAASLQVQVAHRTDTGIHHSVGRTHAAPVERYFIHSLRCHKVAVGILHILGHTKLRRRAAICGDIQRLSPLVFSG